jgi:hypothetical protein
MYGQMCLPFFQDEVAQCLVTVPLRANPVSGV